MSGFCVKESRPDLNFMKPPLKRVSFTFLLIFSAVLFCFFLTEGLFRIYVAVAKPLYRPSSIEGLGWEFTPHATNAARGTQPGPKAYLINNRGFRDNSNQDWTPWHSTDTKIIAVGDSVTAGPSVSYSDTYSARLEEVLRQRTLPARVVNGGVDATNTRQQLAWLQHKGLPLKPDLVLLGYFMNDIETRSFENLPGFAQFFMRHFHFGVFLSQRIVQTIRNHRKLSRYEVDFNPKTQRPLVCGGYVLEILQAYQTEKWQKNTLWIQRMADLCRSNGIHFGVIIFPFEPQIRGICPLQAQSEIAQFLNQAGIPFLDMAESFRKIPSDGFYIPGDPVHLSASGHRAVAEAIGEWLAAQGILQLKMEQ